jgi:xylulokinase
MASLVLGIDAGTTSTKVVLADPLTADPLTGVVAQASAPAALSSPHPGWAEAETAQWWENVCLLVPRVLREAGVTAADVAAVAATGMVPAVIPANADGRPLRPAILQNDTRAKDEVLELAAALPGLDFTALTGSALTQQSVAPTLLWLAKHEPAVWARTAMVLGSYDWLAVALGARPHVERNWAIESGLYALSDGTFLDPLLDWLDRAGIDRDVLPPVADPGTVIGAVSGTAAA